jgi:hypothetical protein
MMVATQPVPGQLERLSSHIRWRILAFFILMVCLGFLVFLLHIAEGTKYFLAGALIGVGAGGGLGEVTSSFERRESSQRMGELREVVLAQCRLAYGMGEYAFNFYAAISKGQNQHPEVEEFLYRADLLGVRTTFDLLVKSADPNNPELHDQLVGRVNRGMLFKGQHLYIFFQIGQDIRAIRGDDAKTKPAARKIVSERVASYVAMASGFTDDVHVDRAWFNINHLWDQGGLESDEIDDLLYAVHKFFVQLGLDRFGYPTWKTILNRLGQMKISGGRSQDLRSVLASIRAAIMQE